MIRKTENNSVLVIRDIPHIRWIGAAVILFSYLFVFVLDFSLNEKSLGDWAGTAMFILLLMALFLYLWSFPATTTKIDRKGKTISVRRQSLLKYSFDVYAFSELSAPIFVREFNSLGSKFFQLIMPLTGDRETELSISANIYQEPMQQKADLVNRFIGGSTN